MTKPPKAKAKPLKATKPAPAPHGLKWGLHNAQGRPRTKPRDLPEIADREQQIAEFLKGKKK